MSTEDHRFCRLLLKEVMAEVRQRVTPDTVNHSWGYKYQGERTCEFHINRCDEVPNSFYWHGQGCCVWAAKAEGWQKFLKQLDKEKEDGDARTAD
jgi:hypothetical protein